MRAPPRTRSVIPGLIQWSRVFICVGGLLGASALRPQLSVATSPHAVHCALMLGRDFAFWEAARAQLFRDHTRSEQFFDSLLLPEESLRLGEYLAGGGTGAVYEAKLGRPGGWKKTGRALVAKVYSRPWILPNDPILSQTILRLEKGHFGRVLAIQKVLSDLGLAPHLEGVVLQTVRTPEGLQHTPVIVMERHSKNSSLQFRKQTEIPSFARFFAAFGFKQKAELQILAFEKAFEELRIVPNELQVLVDLPSGTLHLIDFDTYRIEATHYPRSELVAQLNDLRFALRLTAERSP